jgi:hypothetical protein
MRDYSQGGKIIGQGWEDTPGMAPYGRTECPTCRAFHAAVDAAVAVEREENAVICDGFEESETTAAAAAIRARGPKGAGS